MLLWVLYAFLSAFFSSLIIIFAKVGLQPIDPVVATTIRSFIMSGFLVIICLLLKKHTSTPTNGMLWIDWLFIVASAIAGASSWLFYFLALKYGPIAPVIAIDRLSLAFAIILSAIFLKEVISIVNWIGIALMVGGAYLIVS